MAGFAVSVNGRFSDVRRGSWTRDGKNLLYTGTDDRPLQFWSVSVSTTGGFVPGKPVMIHRGDYLWDPATNYDVAADGRLLLMPSGAITSNRVGSIHIIQRWFDELKRRVP